MAREFDFDLLDDVLPTLAHEKNGVSVAITGSRIAAIGPLLEYSMQAATNYRLPALNALGLEESSAALRRTLSADGFDRVPVSNSHEALGVEFDWVPTTVDEVAAPHWIMFLRRVENAAERSGFPKQVAKQLVGAFVEMADNVLQHSQRPGSGIGAYRWIRGCFEYAVADAGIGALASLRSSSDYVHLVDDGNALQTALQDGESRHGRNSGHGNGFRQVLVSLTNLNGKLRFRSGDHALTMDGTSPDLAHARLHHLGLDYRGLLVSVVCRPN